MESQIRVVDLTERIIYLRTIPVASILPPPVLKILASNFQERIVARGESLMREGEPIRTLHLIVDGKVALIRKGKPFGALVSPRTLGFLGICAGAHGTYDARAEVETRTLALDADAMMELLEDHFEFLRATLRYACERMLAEIQELPVEALNSRLDGVDAIVPADRPLDLVERMAYLRTLSAFVKTNLNALAVMAMTVTEQRLEPGTLVWRAGDHAAENIFVLTGRARCSTPDGKKTWSAGPTSALGGIDSVAARPRWYDLRAETKMCVLRLPVAAFLDLLEDDFPMAVLFMKRVTTDLLGLLEAKAAAQPPG